MQADDGEARRDGIGERVVGREAPGGAGAASARMRFTVRGLGRCPKRAQQMVVISWVLSAAYSRLSSMIAWRIGAGSCWWRSSLGGGARLAMPCWSKASAWR
jgi:hypothetical protein